MVEEIIHTWEGDNLFCTVCGVNRRYWMITMGGPVWCKPKDQDDKTKTDLPREGYEKV